MINNVNGDYFTYDGPEPDINAMKYQQIRLEAIRKFNADTKLRVRMKKTFDKKCQEDMDIANAKWKATQTKLNGY